ncbi:MAG: mannosyltransferase [Pycnora praestabilis]|nr:MAG: mannosyltransferase [Pycnora praestabilis]
MAVLEVILIVFLLGLTVLTIFLLTLPTRFSPRSISSKDENPNAASKKDHKAIEDRNRSITIQILVLGDIGRSPRMQYHALSIANHGGKVDLIGYIDSDLPSALLSNPQIAIQAIHPPPDILQTDDKLRFLLFGPLKVLCQLWSLWIILGYRTEPARWLLVQNPPSIPTLAIAQAICFLRKTKLIIDWHNFGYSILALKLGPSHALVRVSELYEFIFSRSATTHFTVSNAMARVLREQYHITTPVLPLHDRPSAQFQPLSKLQRDMFLARMPETAAHATAIEAGKTRLLVSSTSWTADEDFSILLDALAGYSELATTTHPHLPEILAIITGKGPQKEFYLSQIASLKNNNKLEMVTILTAWLSIEDYAALLGAADLGVSLHMSSSGVDLPMKVVDMFGAGLPVVGWSKFEAWSELVNEDENGRGFGSAEGLREVLIQLFGDTARTELRKLRRGAIKEGQRRWDAEWEPVAGRLFGLCK